MSDYKLLVAGPQGSGKSTAISSLTGMKPLSIDFRVADYDSTLGDAVITHLQHGVVNVGDGEGIHLFELSEPEDKEQVWPNLMPKFLGACIILNNGRPRPLDDLSHYIDVLNPYFRHARVIVGVTHVDEYSTTPLSAYNQCLKQHGLSIPVFAIDARERTDVASLVQALLYSVASTAD